MTFLRTPPLVHSYVLFRPNSILVVQPKTLTSKLGILQNPTGMHQGNRVWGGGIIKVAPKDWIPWPIDLDLDQNYEGNKRN